MEQATDYDSIARHCVELIARAKRLSADQVQLSSPLETLEMDSLDKVSLSFDIEEAYGILIPDTALAKLHTVGDIADGVVAAVEAKKAAARIALDNGASPKGELAATEA